MANKHLKCSPHTINCYSWWYEDNVGIIVVQECRERDTRLYVDTVMTTITWKSLRNALRRKDKKA